VRIVLHATLRRRLSIWCIYCLL